MTSYRPSPENRKKIDEILEENARDVASVISVSMTKQERKDLNSRWRDRLRRMRKIDKWFCQFSGLSMYD